MLVPVEFINRARALIYDSRLDLRKSSRLLIVGDGDVRLHGAAHAGKLAAAPGGVGVDRLPEDELVADGKDDRGSHVFRLAWAVAYRSMACSIFEITFFNRRCCWWLICCWP